MHQLLHLYLLLCLLMIFIAWGWLEWRRHIRNLHLIKYRIVVNGTRGKSSVTRLIAAGIKAGGYTVLAKTTGTSPRLIFNNETENPVIRIGKANIREQINVIREAVRRRCQFVVLENMSLRPDLQIIEAKKLVQPSITVITNIRSDHLDVMGPTLNDIARHFIKAVPAGATVITAEQKMLPILETYAQQLHIRLIAADPTAVRDDEMSLFPYFEHRENVALALAVCQHFGINRDQALKGIARCLPDPGALRVHHLNINGHRINLYNALAANDPDSTYLIYQRIGKFPGQLQVLINCRRDRIDRSLQIADLIAGQLRADCYYLCGQATKTLFHRAVNRGVPREKLIVLERRSFDAIFAEISRRSRADGSLFAIGNIVGYGEQLVNFIIQAGQS